MPSKEYTVSHIRSMGDLRSEIATLKARVKLHEIDLSDRLKQVPQETLKTAAAAVLPAFILKKTGVPTGGILKSATRILFSKNKKEDFKKEFASGVRNIGFMTAVKGITSFIKHRKEKRSQQQTQNRITKM
jgi:hypothetical protein